jgi:hypothetical protein
MLLLCVWLQLWTAASAAAYCFSEEGRHPGRLLYGVASAFNIFLLRNSYEPNAWQTLRTAERSARLLWSSALMWTYASVAYVTLSLWQSSLLTIVTRLMATAPLVCSLAFITRGYVEAAAEQEQQREDENFCEGLLDRI